MDRNKVTIWALALLSAVLMSLPWLVPHAGFVALFGLVPLLCADYIATGLKVRRFWLCHYMCFVLWNALTTFWVCNATVGGGIFAVLANALQMSVVFGLFRFSRRRFSGTVPYIFLAFAWLAWEHVYFDAQISWPWLVLGNAFADSTRLVQWYSATGVLGGSLWIIASNLAIFGMMITFAEGIWWRWNSKAKFAAVAASVLILLGPGIASAVIYSNYEEKSESTLDVVIGQPNFDPYQKFTQMSQRDQTDTLLSLYSSALEQLTPDCPVLLLAPETFTGDVILNDPESSATLSSFRRFLSGHPQCEILFGASTYEIFEQRSCPTILARPYGQGWILNHNSAILAGQHGSFEKTHKGKLVVATELTPYPKLFVPIDNWLSKLMGVGGLMGRCAGQDEPEPLHLRDSLAFGCAVCYESIYGDWCTRYVDKGARFMTVITNDAWWGDTPGYHQHMNYSRLRAIELRRDVARCGNTGISGFIDQRGDVVSRTDWWTRCTIAGKVNLNSERTFFSIHGDIVGRISVMFFLLLLLALVVRLIKR